MNALRIGSLCTGYGGLDVAVQAVVGGEHAWMAENDPHASKVLAHHWPAVPNLGDVTVIDWAAVEPVDVLVAGFPCQDISQAGKRAGITGKRSGIWRNVAEAVGALRPALVILENVAGIRTRGLDVVIDDLTAAEYMPRWTYAKASAHGATHARDRWFGSAEPVESGSRVGCLERPAGTVEPVPALLPTPAVADADGTRATRGGARSNELLLNGIARLVTEEPGDPRWGKYEPAIRRWETVTGRSAPYPTEPAPRGGRRLAPAFSEWMMGLPAGHVTDVPCLSRNAQLRIIGGGVVPRQGIAAIESLMAELERRAAA